MGRAGTGTECSVGQCAGSSEEGAGQGLTGSKEALGKREEAKGMQVVCVCDFSPVFFMSGVRVISY